MKLVRFFTSFSLLLTTSIFGIQISPEPVAVYKTPNSIMHRLSPAWAQNIGDRSRFSTCTGVAWFADNTHLISANLLEDSLQIYQFYQGEHILRAKKKYSNNITKLGWPENLTISCDGTLLAVSNSATGKICVYKINLDSNLLHPSPIAFVEAGDQGLHGIRFSPDGNYLAYVTYDGLGKIRVFRVTTPIKGSSSFDLVESVDSAFEDLAPKGIAFSHNMNYVAVCYSTKIRSGWAAPSGKLAIFKFNAKTGKIDQAPICEIGTDDGLNTPEDVLFFSDNSLLLVSNQGNDTITAHNFDQTTGLLSESRVILGSPQSGLNFPHGIAISPNGERLAVSNYGDDKVSIYLIQP